ncbi:MAG: YIP1 family protein [Pyrinomonadaceae bacterium]|nr:YIP1 family protein [Pyrinomonadaceae bacterium]
MSDENREWTEPPLPEAPVAVEEYPQMSEASSLFNIFFEPGRTFEFLRVKPKFIMATLIIIVLTVLFQTLFVSRIGETRMRRFVTEQMEKNPRVQSLPADQKESIVNQQVTISRYVGRFGIPVFIAIFFVILTLLYWGGASAMGGSISFLRALSVVVYSSFPPTVIGMLANIIILFLKDPDDIDIATSQRGLVHANPTLFFEGKEMPVLTTLISTLDVFQIWGWVLAAIGLTIMARISKTSGWTVVLIIALIGITLRVVGAMFSGNPS